jgi:hypothetical protein
MPCDSDSVWGALTRQFYAWQFRGRGWQVYDRPVSIEPPFRPFFGHFVAGINSVVDDGRKSMRLSSFFDRLGSRRESAPPLSFPVEVEPEPAYTEHDMPVVEIQVALRQRRRSRKTPPDNFCSASGTSRVRSVLKWWERAK